MAEKLALIHPPPEIRDALEIKPGEQCFLENGVYGRLDAPFLWFQNLKETLEEPGFVQCPFDACTFSLVTPTRHGKLKIHGGLGIHVDDSIRGGDIFFSQTVQKLRERYSFGSYDDEEFSFTGIRFRQWDDGNMEMDQAPYIEKIPPINIPRARRLERKASLTADEVHELRRLNGSLQYAGVHPRPDTAAEVRCLQSVVNKREVGP